MTQLGRCASIREAGGLSGRRTAIRHRAPDGTPPVVLRAAARVGVAITSGAGSTSRPTARLSLCGFWSCSASIGAEFIATTAVMLRMEAVPISGVGPTRRRHSAVIRTAPTIAILSAQAERGKGRTMLAMTAIYKRTIRLRRRRRRRPLDVTEAQCKGGAKEGSQRLSWA